jgi:hypothetical protein
VAAVLLTVVVSSTPHSGTLAALPHRTGAAQAGPISRDDSAPAPARRPLPPRAAGTPAAVADDSEVVPLPAVPASARALDALARVPEPSPTAVATAAPTAAPALAASASPAVVRAAGRPAGLWAQLRDGLTVAGVATWYPGTRGYAGIPHVAMPGARYLAHGRTAPRAQVCAGDRCTVVRVVDACACFVGTRRARVVDLSATALLRLGLDHRRGVYQVRVTLLAP